MINFVKRLFRKPKAVPVAVSDKIDVVKPMKKKTATKSKKKGK